MTKHIVIAIDGPAGSGKSTVARRVAERLGFTLLDTGAMYRAVALAARDAGVGWDDEPRLASLAAGLPIEFVRDGATNRVVLDGRDVTGAIRAPEISDGASRVSRLPAVRDALLAEQRAFAERSSLVTEGRDVTTVVFPRATLKVFLDADLDVRARRRYEELRASGRDADFEQVRRAERARDEADTTRAVAPLRRASDALYIDTTGLTIDEVIERVLAGLPGDG